MLSWGNWRHNYQNLLITTTSLGDIFVFFWVLWKQWKASMGKPSPSKIGACSSSNIICFKSTAQMHGNNDLLSWPTYVGNVTFKTQSIKENCMLPIFLVISEAVSNVHHSNRYHVGHIIGSWEHDSINSVFFWDAATNLKF